MKSKAGVLIKLGEKLINSTGLSRTPQSVNKTLHHSLWLISTREKKKTASIVSSNR